MVDDLYQVSESDLKLAQAIADDACDEFFYAVALFTPSPREAVARQCDDAAEDLDSESAPAAAIMRQAAARLRELDAPDGSVRVTRESLRAALASADLDEICAKWGAGRGFDGLVDVVLATLTGAATATDKGHN
jgi:hypothetical protein